MTTIRTLTSDEESGRWGSCDLAGSTGTLREMRSHARWFVGAVIAAGLTVAFPAAVSAQVDDADARALSLYRAGETAFHAGEYEAALDLFQRAYGLSPRPRLLHNMALCADRLRQDVRAADLYTQYLDREPQAENREEIEARLRALRRAIERNEQAPPVEATPAVPAADVGPRDATSEPWFWPVVGGGIALVLAGVVVGIVVGTQPTDEPYRTGDVGGVVFALQGTF